MRAIRTKNKEEIAWGTGTTGELTDDDRARRGKEIGFDEKKQPSGRWRITKGRKKTEYVS